MWAQSQDMHQTGIKKWGIYAAVNSYFWTSIGSLKIKQLMTDTARWNQSQLILKFTRENEWGRVELSRE